MIDLKTGAVRLVPYQKEWEYAFEQEKKQIKRILGNTAIDIRHVGSTAIPGMDAKPVIDILVGVKELHRDPEMEERLRSVGYEFQHQKESDLLYVKNAHTEHTLHLHMLKYNGIHWKSYISFRNFLIKNRDMAEKYRQLKHSLLSRFKGNKEAYKKNKEEFIQDVLEQAEEQKQ